MFHCDGQGNWACQNWWCCSFIVFYVFVFFIRMMCTILINLVAFPAWLRPSSMLTKHYIFCVCVCVWANTQTHSLASTRTISKYINTYRIKRVSGLWAASEREPKHETNNERKREGGGDGERTSMTGWKPVCAWKRLRMNNMLYYIFISNHNPPPVPKKALHVFLSDWILNATPSV